MIPEFYDDVSTPPGERDVFIWLAGCPAEWIVFHSLDLQAWNRHRQTEIDFVVIIPEHGLLCIEVKSHEEVEVTESGEWRLGGVPQKRSPLKQAEDAAKVLQRRIATCLIHLKHIPVCRMVLFPRSVLEVPKGVEHNHWEIADVTQCHNAIKESGFRSLIESSLRRSVDQSGVVRALQNPLSSRDKTDLRNLLRPAFKSLPSSTAENLRRRQHIEDLLRSQQKPILNLYKSNDHIIVEGPAGSGKTLIALEIARRSAESGARTGLICFNRLIGDYIESKSSKGGSLIVAGSIHSLMSRMFDIAVPESPSSDYWRTVFLDEVEEAMISNDRMDDCPFDFLILDEAQDILANTRLFGFAEYLVRGGFAEGRWALFGDFKNQVFSDVSARASIANHLLRLKKISSTASYELDENCRNYAIIGRPCISLAGMKDVYSGFTRGDGGPDSYTPIFFNSKSSFISKLEAEIVRYGKEGISKSDIVVLTCAGLQQSLASELVGADRLLKRYGDFGDRVAFASVFEFKGLESSVVILVDVREPIDERDRDAFYVGMTRATYAVSLFIPQDIHPWFFNASMKVLT